MKGKLYVVGIGPGNVENMTIRAYETLRKSDVIIGYKTYTDLISNEFKDKEIIVSGMKKEVERSIEAINIAKSGKITSVISSGDAGVYGMAGIILEIADDDIEVEVIPGVTAANSVAAIAGAPIMHDCAYISLSDLLTEWDLIKKRVEAAAEADFVVVIYNPKSMGRPDHINTARDIILSKRKGTTPVAIVRNAGREEEELVITNIDKMLEHKIDMVTTVIIGNSNTFVKNGKMITPRGYRI